MFETIAAIPGIHLYGLVLSIVIAIVIHLRAHRTLDRRQRFEVAAMYSIGVIGFHGFTSFVVHTVFADPIATSIGWAPGSPFQTEVAGANLAIGLIGFLGFWRKDMWLPFILAKFGFMWTAGATHVIDLVERGNVAVNNAGPIIYWDFLVPVVLLALFVLQGGRFAARSADAPLTSVHAST